MALRKHDRIEYSTSASWDFFQGGSGAKVGYLDNISRTGCLLRVSEPIDHQQKIRVIVRDHENRVGFTLIGRAVRCENRIEAGDESEDVTLYRYGIEFTFPAMLASQDFDLILALSSRNFKVRSCRTLNSRSSFLPGFLA